MSDETLVSGAEAAEEVSQEAAVEEGRAVDKADAAEVLYDTDKVEEEVSEADKPEDKETDADKKSEDEPDKDKAEDDKGTEQAYDTFNLPDGIDMNEDALAKISPIFTELGLNQEQAQKIIDGYSSFIQTESEQRADALKTTHDEWVNGIKGHEELGGKNLDASLAFSASAIDVLFGDKASDFRSFLNDTGMGNNPFMFEMLAKVGKSVSEDGFVLGGNATREKSAEETLYPSMSKPNK